MSEINVDKCCSPFSPCFHRKLKKLMFLYLEIISQGKKKTTQWVQEWSVGECWLPSWLQQYFWQCLYCSICTLFFLQMLPLSSLREAAGLWDFWQKHLASHTLWRIQMFVLPQRLKQEFHSGNIYQKSKYRY